MNEWMNEYVSVALCTIQNAGRAFLAYRRLHYLRMHRAAVCLQANMRAHVQHKKYIQLRAAVLHIQACVRANAVRKQLQKVSIYIVFYGFFRW